MKGGLALILTSEHGGNTVPQEHRAHFASKDAKALLDTHRGFDPGSLEIARALERRFDVPLVASTVTRLLVDLNRSLGSKELFSEFTDKLGEPDKHAIIEGFWRPHRDRVERAIEIAMGETGAVLHIAVHSFTPVLDGVERDIDVALLYDPKREREKDFSNRWIKALEGIRDDLRIGRNRPYRGVSDGLTSHLRKVHGPERYVGIELEVNQRFPKGGRGAWRRLIDDLGDSLATACGRRPNPA